MPAAERLLHTLPRAVNARRCTSFLLVKATNSDIAMNTIRRFFLIALALIGAGVASGCVYYPARPYRAEFYPDGYTPYYTDYYARPYVDAVWIGGYYHHDHWVRPHWR